MPLLSITRLLAALLSAAVLAAAGYLLWTWRQGEWIRDPAGVLVRVRSDWRLGIGAGLLAWSFLGRLVFPLLLAKGGGPTARARHGAGTVMTGATGSSIYVERHGPAGAPILVFTHGWGMDLTFWEAARQHLSKRFHLVLWDLPGLGRSRPPPDGKITVANFASDLSALLQTLERPAVLVGHSIGGMTLQTLVRDHPEASDRIAGIVLLNTTYTNPLRTMILGRLFLFLQRPLIEPAMHLTVWLQPLVWLSKWQSYLSGFVHAGMRFGFGKFVTRTQLEHAAFLATRAPPAVEAKGNLDMLRWDATGATAYWPKPLLVVGGDQDIVTKLAASETIAARTPAAHLKVIAGVNHMGPMERADLYSQAIAEFADSLKLGPRGTSASAPAGAAPADLPIAGPEPH
jgi:pimeloyl-ACP methyl ester carboxylesterase